MTAACCFPACLCPLAQVAERDGKVQRVARAQFKHVCQIEHTRHRSPYSFLAHLLAGLVAYCHLPKKPSLHLDRDLPSLPTA